MPPEELAVEAAPVAPTAAPQAADAPPPSADGNGAAPENPEAPKPDAPKPERTFTQAELSRIVARNVAKEARRIEREVRTSVENEYLRRQVEAPRPTASAGDSAGGKPQLKDFPDYESFVEAVADWRAEQKIEARLKAETERVQKQSDEQRSQERRAYIQERVVERGAALYEDFEDVALAPDLPITEPMLLTLAESDHAAVAAYYLGQHPEEAARISKLSAPSQVRELDKLIATLTKPAEPSKAPPPIKPSAANGSVGERLEGASMADFIKIRQRQIAQR